MSAPVLDTPTFEPSHGIGVLKAHLNNDAATFRQVQIANDVNFTSIAVDTGLVPMDSVAAGGTVIGTVNLGALVNQTAYYVRIGVANATYPTAQWSAAVQFTVQLPFFLTPVYASNTDGGQIIGPTETDGTTWQGGRCDVQITVQDTTRMPVQLTVYVDDVAMNVAPPMPLVGNGQVNLSYTPPITAVTHTFIVHLKVERGVHTFRAVASNNWGAVTQQFADIVASYTLSETGLAVYAGNVQLEATDIALQDAQLPDFPSLSFVAPEYTQEGVTCILKDRGLRTYNFIARYISKRDDGLYAYRCDAVERRVFEQEHTIQVQSAASLDILTRAIPGIGIVNSALLTEVLGEQSWENVEASAIVEQVLTTNYCTGAVRNGRLYVLPLDMTGKRADMVLHRADQGVEWQRDADMYGKVRVYYSNRQYPLPASKFSNKAASTWTGTVADVRAIPTSLLPAPSGAPYCLQASGAISKAGLSIPVSSFDRFLMAWDPATATSITVSLQDDAANKLEFVRTFQGGTGSGVIVAGAAADAIATLTITATGKRIVQLTGNLTQACSYRCTLMDGATTVWQGVWTPTSGIDNEMLVDVPQTIYSAAACASIVLEFKGLYQVNAGYGVQITKLDIQEYSQQTVPTGHHDTLVSTTHISGWSTAGAPRQIWEKQATSTATRWDFRLDAGAVPPLVGDTQRYEFANQRFEVRIQHYDLNLDTPADMDTFEDAVCSLAVEGGRLIATYSFDKVGWTPEGGYLGAVPGAIAAVTPGTLFCDVLVYDTIVDTSLVWLVLPWAWGGTSMNLWDAMDVPAALMTKTGNPVTIKTIVLTATGTWYCDSPHVVSSDPAPRYVDVGMGNRVLECRTENFVSEAAAAAYARGMLALVTQAKEQYSKQIALGCGIGVGDVVYTDAGNITVYAASYDDAGVTITAGRPISNTVEALKEAARRLDALEQYVTR